jgi:hypothetical protein
MKDEGSARIVLIHPSSFILHPFKGGEMGKKTARRYYTPKLDSVTPE